MSKVLVITREDGKPGESKLLMEKADAVVDGAQGVPSSGLNDPEVDTLLIDIETLLSTDNSLKQALDALWERYPSAEVVVMADSGETKHAVDAVKAGAFDYLTHPIGREELDFVVDRVRESDMIQSELDYLRDQFWSEDFREVVNTRSGVMRDVFDKVRQVAGTRTTILLTGETGTGKSLLAKLLHSHSTRMDGPFISVHCGAIPDTLVESEFFGHEKGAFTGASRRKLGKFELANGGTIFLDEIGTISQSAQIKLLNAIQSRTIQRLGGEVDIPVDVRIIAATNDNLEQMCRDGLFRWDLYYRLNVFPLNVPPLRERSEDILKISETCITQFNAELGKDIKTLHPEVVDAFLKYDWPGNVRELENLIERACILEQTNVLTPSSFPVEFFGDGVALCSSVVRSDLPLTEARKLAVEAFEKSYLDALLSQTGGSIKSTSELAGVSTRQVNKLMTKHRLVRKSYKKRTKSS